MKKNLVLSALLCFISVFYSENLFAQICLNSIFTESEVSPCVSTTPYFYQVTPLSAGMPYTWTISGGGYEFMNGGTGNYQTIKWTTSGQKTIRVNRSGCASSYDAVLIVNVGSPAPIMPASINGNLSPCLGTSVYSVPSQPGQTYTWTLIKNGSIDSANPLTPNGNQVTINWTQTGYYQLGVTSNNGNCTSNILRADINVGIYEPEVSPSHGSLENGCKNSLTVYTVTGGNPINTYAWSLSPGGATLTPSGNTATVNWGSSAGPYTLSVTGTNNCGSSTKTMTLNMQDTPVKPVLTPSISTACIANGIPVYISSDPTANFYMVNPNENYSVELNNGNPYVNFLAYTAGAKTFTVKAFSPSNCQSQDSDPVTINVVDNTITPVISGSNSICNNSPGPHSYYIQNSSASFKWTVPAGVCLLNGTSATSVVANSVSITWQAPGLHTIQVSPNATTCIFPTTEFQVAVHQPVTPEDISGITGSSSVCLLNGASARFPYRVDYANVNSSLNDANIVSWSLSSGGTVFETRPSSSIIQWTSAGTHTLTATISNACSGNVVKTLSVTPVVTTTSVANALDIVGDATTCPFQPALYHVVGPTPTTYAWNTSGIQMPPTTATDTYARWISKATNHFISYSTHNGTCYQEPIMKTINVSKRSQTISMPANSAQIAGSTITLPGTSSAGLGLSYSVSNPAIATLSGNSLTFTGSGMVIVYARQDGDGCYMAAPIVSTTYTVSKASQTISFNALASKTYGEAAFNLTATASSGLAITYTSSDPAVATISGNQVTIVGAGTAIITASQSGNTIYSAATSASRSLLVNKASQTITFNALPVKTYGNVSYTITVTSSTGLPVTLTSLAPTVISLSGNVATIVNAGTANISATQAGNANYNAASEVIRPQLVNKVVLTVIPSNLTRVYGGTIASYPLTYSGFVNGETISVIDTPPTATAPTVTSGSMAGIYTIIASGGTDNNYLFQYVDAALTITKASLQATADNKSKTYGTANPSFTVSYTGFVNGETAAVIDNAPTASTTATSTSNVGFYPITLSGGADLNYTITLINGTLTVNKATLQATASNKARTYGEGNPPLTISYSGFVNSETISVIDTQPTAATTATANSPVGSYLITASGGLDNNYTLIYIDGTLSVNKASLQATADNKSRPFGAANPAFTISYTGFVNGETASVIDASPTLMTTATSSSHVGTYAITISGGSDNNYTFVYSNGNLIIDKASLQIIADDKNKTYRAANPALTISYSGFVNGETASVIDVAPTATTTSTVASNAGTYPITPAGGSDNNYTFTYVSGTLTVNKATLQVTADNKSRTYGVANPTFTFSYSGFLNGETAAVIDTPPTGSTTADLTTPVGTYSIIPVGGTDNNYTFNYVNGTLTITKASLLATCNMSRPYNTANPTFVITYTGLKNGETAYVIDVPPTASTSATVSSPVGSYTITLSGGSDNNYSIAVASGTLTITKANQTVIFSPIPTKCGTGSVSLVASSSSGLTVVFSSANTAIATISGSTANALQPGTVTITASQSGNANYNAASATQSLVIASLPAKPAITQIGCVCEQYVTLQASGGTNYVWSTEYVGQTVNMVTSADYYVTSTGANGCSRQSNLFTVIIPSCTSDPCGGGPQSRMSNDTDIKSEELQVTEATLYPNPADATLTIHLPEPVKQNVTVSLYSQYGQEVKSAVLVKGEYKIEFDTKLLSKGMYVLTLRTTSGNINMNRKVIINH